MKEYKIIIFNPRFLQKHGISIGIAEKMGLQPFKDPKSGYQKGFHDGKTPAKRRMITTVEMWDKEISKPEHQQLKIQSDRLKIAYIKQMEAEEQKRKAAFHY